MQGIKAVEYRSANERDEDRYSTCFAKAAEPALTELSRPTLGEASNEKQSVAG
jgi:hypothetical protein